MIDTTITLGVPVYNDEEFIDMSVKNAIDVGYEHVVYLDDGSTDGSLEKLKRYSQKYNHIYVYSNNRNSVNNQDENRWYTLAKLCKEFNTDWIMVRSTDEIFSYMAHRKRYDLLRKKLNRLICTADMVKFPRVNLHRSNYWYRDDGLWHGFNSNQSNICCWNNRNKWDFVGPWKKSGFHAGAHRPNYFEKQGHRIKANIVPFNDNGLLPHDLVVLHYGLSTHERMAKKLEYQIKTAKILGGGTDIMDINYAPPVKEWRRINGYKMIMEFDIILRKVPQKWFKDPVPDEPKPKIESFYDILVKYNVKRAEEYKKIYEEFFGK